ncbi:hypothetical protein QOZ88_19325 [Blastococcus sp. BMG 814]|uniref:Uncharacterized protein n=1 Tax=Blastococcus carthaginiensis TaxID=3050034 RepID=A0ABT9IGS3_9ACTN|nr:hypothetical protein [Blastococcus carthaginiensis]MDP5184790.1 hypothetical protein [Blastococcus carthaginiensis]
MSTIPLPPGLWERIRAVVRDEVGKLLRSGFLRSASIGEGGLTLRGGFLRLKHDGDGVETFYVGPVSPDLPDGSKQPGVIIRRNDGTIALHLYDPIPSEGDYNQFLAWRDRQGHVVFSDDTDSGQGIALPYIPFAFYRSRNEDWPVVTSTAWTTVYRAKGPKQQPKLYVETWGANNTDGATGQVRVLVNGTELATPGDTASGVVRGFNFGPAAVSGDHLSTLSIEVQARMVSGAGGVQVGVGTVQGRQS